MADFPERPGFGFHAVPPKEALKFFRAKGLKPSFNWADVWREEHARHFTVAKMMELDLLKDVQTALDRSLERGLTFHQFQRSIKPLLIERGWWGKKDMADPVTGEMVEAQLGSPRRLRLIYDVNLRTARAAGQWERIQRTKKSHPYLRYSLGPSANHRKEHVRWNGLILPVDHPFWRTHFPPNGWGCKCRVRQVSGAEMDRRGWKVSPDPKIERRAWVKKRTDEKLQIPRGIDPGWDHNHGMGRNTHGKSRLVDKLDATPNQLAIQAAQTLVDSPAFSGWLKRPEGNFPVGVLDQKTQSAIGVESQVAVLSPDTLFKQRRHHPELQSLEYRLIPLILESGTVIKQGETGLRFLVYAVFGRRYTLALKVTQDKKELFVLSLFRVKAATMRARIRKGEMIREGKE